MKERDPIAPLFDLSVPSLDYPGYLWYVLSNLFSISDSYHLRKNATAGLHL